MVHYAVTIGLIFAGCIIAMPWIGARYPAAKPFCEGLAGYSTIIGALVALGGVVGLVYLLLSIGSFGLFWLLTVAGCGLAVTLGVLLLMNLLKKRQELPQEKLALIERRLTGVQIPLGLAGIGYGAFMLVYSLFV